MNSRLLTTLVLFIYIALIPYWLLNVTLVQVFAFYFMYWFLCDWIQSSFMHRYAAHNLWNPPVWVQYVGATIGIIGLIGSPIGWAAWHRTHHAHSDTKKDPHSPLYKSAWFIVFKYKYHKAEVRRAVDRMRHPYYTFVLKYERSFVVLGNLALFTLLPFQWFLTLWAVPITIMIINTNFFLNVASHRDGKSYDRPYLWPVLFAECYHGSHHNMVKMSYTKWDPAGYIIRKMGWMRNETN